VRTIAFQTFNTTPVANTAVIGYVYASVPIAGGNGATTNHPLENVTITVDGQEETLRATTDKNGAFSLNPCPAGRFFVKIDGRTATGSLYPLGAYYPFVGKPWEAIAGVTNNLAGGTGLIYLPLIAAGTLQPTSLTTNTTITFPASVLAANPGLAGVFVTIPANSLFSDDGTRGGRVGIAPVSPDRLPAPLPPGIHPSLVITIQTDGADNLDQPAPGPRRRCGGSTTNRAAGKFKDRRPSVRMAGLPTPIPATARASPAGSLLILRTAGAAAAAARAVRPLREAPRRRPIRAIRARPSATRWRAPRLSAEWAWASPLSPGY
jgi:hypothetical protein